MIYGPKFILISLFLALASSSLTGQTLIGINGGVNWTALLHNNNENSDYVDNHFSYPSYSFQLEIKGRRPKPFHLGASLMYYQSSFKWHEEVNGHFPYGQDVHYNVDYLRISVFPEFSFGKRVQFFCNISPYLNIRLQSSKSGTSWSYQYVKYYELVYKSETGSGNDDLHQLDFGIQESIGVSYLIRPWFGLTLEENASLGFLAINKTYLDGEFRNANIFFRFGVSFIIPGNNSKKKKAVNEPKK